MLEPLRRLLHERLGRSGTLLLGVVMVALFVAVGGPLWVASLSSSLVAVLLFAAVLIAPAAWVLRDARRRALDHAFLWALFALCGNAVAVIVYLLARDTAARAEPCTCCGRAMRAQHAACPWCGSPRSGPAGACKQCRNPVERGWRFCPYCRCEMGGN